VAAKTEKVFRSFVKGLITEASPLTFPENASIDEQNFVLNRDGSRSRRLGLDYEGTYAKTSTGLTADDIKEGKQSFHRWDTPSGTSSIAIGVVRVKNKLWFVDLLTSAPSANLLNSGNPITITGLSNNNIETSTLNNQLIIVGKDLDKPVVLSYDYTTDTVSQRTVDIKVRDIWGLDDSLEDDERPATLSDEHKYNLRNQGWNENIVTKGGGDALDETFTALSAYPSNSDQWTLGKISNSSDADYEKFDPEVLEKNSQSRYSVSRGSIVIDAFDRGSSREAGTDVTGLNSDTETGNISTVASYAQRIFYSGIDSTVTDGDAKSPNYSGYIFFTKVVTSDSDFGKCYQEADPTDPGINDIIDSDGGTIQIPEATRIVKIASSQSSLLVFAENGIWEIYGDTGGFIASSFQANKISTNGIFNANSVVNINGNFMYWSKAGIYTLVTDAASGRFRAETISLTTIQTLFLQIPDIGKNNCKGFYDEKENRVRWLYNDADDITYTNNNYINRYTKELVFDLTLQAFYTNVFSQLATSSPYVADYIEVPGYAISSFDEAVLVTNGNTVIDSNSDTVVTTEDLLLNRSSQFSYLTIAGTNFTISKFNNLTFKDWVTEDGTGANYSSYLVTGYELFNDVMRDKQTPYIFFYFNRTEDGYTADGANLILNNQSSCKVQAQWNWANSANSGKWGNEFQAYRLLRNYIPSGSGDPFDYGDGVIVTKSKLRGSGKTLSIKISSEEGKDMKLLGWAVPATTTSVV
jgi:hypothetical protein